ncbi:MAG: GNAT family N-acetyltransferase [Acidobacteria bacterium]|nr:GNAT family N-acetyltransferase [Acidobacteriota bacterium]
MKDPLLQTRRLELRRFTEADIPELVRLIGAREVAANTLRIPHPYTADDAREFLDGHRARPDFAFAIVLRIQRRLIGGIGLHPETQHQRAELGYWVGVPYWGKGYATEAAQAVVRYGFDQLGLNRIFASHFRQNPASGKVLKKLGMRHEGRMRQHVLKWGEFMDIELYSILREEVAGRK